MNLKRKEVRSKVKIMKPNEKFSKINLELEKLKILESIQNIEISLSRNDDENILHNILYLIDIAYKLDDQDLKVFIFLIFDKSFSLNLIKILKSIKNEKTIEKTLELIIIITKEETDIFIKSNLVVILEILLESVSGEPLVNIFWIFGNLVHENPILKKIFIDIRIIEKCWQKYQSFYTDDNLLGGFIILLKSFLLTPKNVLIFQRNKIFDIILFYFLKINQENFFFEDCLEVLNLFLKDDLNVISLDFNSHEELDLIKKLVNLLVISKKMKNHQMIILKSSKILKTLVSKYDINAQLIKMPLFKFIQQIINTENIEFNVFESVLHLLNRVLEKNEKMVLEHVFLNSTIIEDLYHLLSILPDNDKKLKQISYTLTLLFDFDILMNFYVEKFYFIGFLIEKLKSSNLLLLNNIIDCIKEILNISKVFEIKFGENPIVYYVNNQPKLISIMEKMSVHPNDQVSDSISNIIEFYFN